MVFSVSGNKPDQATLCRFRNKITKEKIWEKLFDLFNRELESKGVKIQSGGYIVADATLVQSARRPRKSVSTSKNEEGIHEVGKTEYSDDTEARYVKKGKKIVYGYNSYMSSDKDGIVLSVNVTPANESEITHFSKKAIPKNLPEKTAVLYDKGADSNRNREELKKRGLRDGIMRKNPKGKKLGHWEKQRNKIISKYRHVIERVFSTIKRSYGFHRARYIGLDKVTGEAYIKACAYNLKRACNIYHALEKGKLLSAMG